MTPSKSNWQLISSTDWQKNSPKVSMQNKDWWRPIWRNQLFGDGGNMRHQIGAAIWLYLYLILHVNPQTGCLRTKVDALAWAMDAPERSVRLWLKTMKDAGLIVKEGKSRPVILRVIHYRFFDR